MKKAPAPIDYAMRPVQRTSVSDEIIAQITDLIERNSAQARR